jgi:SAM-dependent methyltransferase
MSFDAGWLDLRAGADRAACDPGLRAAALGWLDAVPAPLVVDLGCGTGALWRDFARPTAQWRLVDNDPALLAHAAERCPGAETVIADLAAIDALPLQGARLVTASALLDLASAAWLDALAARLARAGAAVYARLSYNGTMEWRPARADDAAVLAAFNVHQCRDKGLGPAHGPGAAGRVAAALAEHGYHLRTADSPWRLGRDHGALIAALVEGVAAAAAETGLADTAAWAQARRASQAASVGHADVLALPASAQSKTTSESSP